jgi:hypothetical protein
MLPLNAALGITGAIGLFSDVHARALVPLWVTSCRCSSGLLFVCRPAENELHSGTTVAALLLTYMSYPSHSLNINCNISDDRRRITVVHRLCFRTLFASLRRCRSSDFSSESQGNVCTVCAPGPTHFTHPFILFFFLENPIKHLVQ